ncbi:DUF2071 domain-containing protein [Fibrella sp. HMF5335]|uniref:DUF2071 domain-containing protein n=1 Tax=Fibrella rubiginis TaxID=2817060 RepID=A0A939K3N9_9BACT|nr:DUF2071 domain-containing protein [Fibrella rubiginis]MBO0939457.1 DUF2071 domain-containing protein [Fibrella rubiginis]
MAFSLKNHPFAVTAFFSRSTVLTYAFPANQLADRIPPCLQLDTFRDAQGRDWAFVAVAMVQTNHLRPAGFPAWLGNDFFLVGYRIFVTYTTSMGKRLRGLYILKSETDKLTMSLLGNIFTHYNYTHIDLSVSDNGSSHHIVSRRSGLDISVEQPIGEVPLPAGSTFTDWKTARRYAGPLPFTFTYYPTTQEVLIIEGRRENWTPHPVVVQQHKTSFWAESGLETPLLASAFTVQNIPYSWKKGRLDPWKP